MYPQHLTPVPEVTAQAWKSLMLTATIPLSGVASLDDVRTSTGTDWEVLLPIPNCEYWLYPQHLTFPPDVNAQVLSPPAEIFSMLLSGLELLEDVGTLIVGDGE